MTFAHKIAAIKALRELTAPDRTFTVVRNIHTSKYELDARNISLKEAKDFVEAVMELGVQRFLEDQLHARKPAVPAYQDGGDY